MDLDRLNTSQREVVLATKGPIMVLAGAGSGKTRTLVAKIAHLISKEKLGPYQLLALTFSNKAAREMRERVSLEVPFDIGSLQITTFHSFCARILRSEATYLGLSRNFTIYGPSESKAIIKSILGRRGISQKEVSPASILQYIEGLKHLGHFKGRKDQEDEVDMEELYYSFFVEYEQELHRANALDFGGLITGVIELFQKFPDVRGSYQRRFQYVLVDEYQDTNRAQFQLIKFFSEMNSNICVVGDEDQSIYSWRGADIRNILDFEETFPEVKVLKLEQNYRSSKNIIEAASFVISHNSMRKGKEMWTENQEGEAIEIIECHNDKKESEFIGETIKNLIKDNKSDCDYGDIAVFYRTNSQSRMIEDYLRKLKIPYRVVGGIKFYERKEIKDLLAYIRVIVNPKDSLALVRIINLPPRGIGPTTLRKLEQEAVDKKITLFELLADLVDNFEKYSHIRLNAKVKSALSEFYFLLSELKGLSEEKINPSKIYEKVLHESGYYEFVKSQKDYESLARLENLEELGNAIVQFEEENKDATLLSFLETISLDQSVSESGEEEPQSSGEVSLMTIHGAKGLEFPYVFLAGAEENIFPSFMSLEEGANGIEEERRLFYVAMTRAMKKLFITFGQARLLYGSLKFNGPSRFIHEIPEKFYSWKKFGVEKRPDFSEKYYSSDDDYSGDFSFHREEKIHYQIKSPKKSAPSLSRSKYQKGMVVEHSLYGKGKVLDSSGMGNEEKVTIVFDDGSKKKFMVKFAPLTLIN